MKKKVQYKQKQVKFLGHIFDEKGVCPDSEQVKAIIQLKEPSNKVELQRILGMINYLRDYVPNMSQVSAPLRELSKKDIL